MEPTSMQTISPKWMEHAEPEIVLPEQVERLAATSGTAHLWGQAIIVALKDVARAAGATATEQREAVRWFLSRSEEPRSFRWACYHIGLGERFVEEIVRRVRPVAKAIERKRRQ